MCRQVSSRRGEFRYWLKRHSSHQQRCLSSFLAETVGASGSTRKGDGGVRNSRNESSMGHARIFHREERNRKWRITVNGGRAGGAVEMAAGKHISPASSLKSGRRRTEEKLEHISAMDALIVPPQPGGRIRVFSFSSLPSRRFLPSFYISLFLSTSVAGSFLLSIQKKELCVSLIQFSRLPFI